MFQEHSKHFFQLIPEKVAAICARFGGYPTDYMRSHDWGHLVYDSSLAIQLNQMDQEKEKQMFNSINPGGGRGGKNR